MWYADLAGTPVTFFYPCFRVKPRPRGPVQSGGDTSDQPGAPSRGRLAGGA